MRRVLEVHREIEGAFQSVGLLLEDEGGIKFSYDGDYLSKSDAVAIATCFPLGTECFTAAQTKAFFDGLLPEGPLRQRFDEVFRASENEYFDVLARLNYETAGALIFCAEGADPFRDRSYRPIEFIELDAFARQPLPKAFDMDTSSRLSLAGAQAKVGLMHTGEEPRGGWSLPLGSAPSTHIVKACNGVFEGQTVNEALCMRTAANAGFEVAECALIPIKDAEPLLAVKRFDRVWEGEKGFPGRLHQEDLGQVLQVVGRLKYEPTDGHYPSLVADAIQKISSNPFGDRVFFFGRLLFDWLIGNCDNHLKNHSFVWSSDWSKRELSPLYDITCTTFYPQFDKEMGISLCESRRIDDVTIEDLGNVAHAVGVPDKIASREANELAQGFRTALQEAEKGIVAEGFPVVSEIASHIRETSEPKLQMLKHL